MTDNDILVKVKAGIGITGTSLDTKLLQLLAAVKAYMTNYGITTTQIEASLGIQCMTVGVQDLLNASPGEAKFSIAFDLMLGQLHHICLPEVEDDV